MIQLILGNFYMDQAVLWIKKSAEQENAEAQFELALFYYNGTGTKVDKEKGTYWMEKAAKNGHRFAKHFLEGMEE